MLLPVLMLSLCLGRSDLINFFFFLIVFDCPRVPFKMNLCTSGSRSFSTGLFQIESKVLAFGASCFIHLARLAFFGGTL